MSFSITVKGTPEDLKTKLAEYSAQLTDQSKQEFDAVKPALETLLDQHQNDGLVVLSANGHASFKDGVRTYSTGSVTITGNQAAD